MIEEKIIHIYFINKIKILDGKIFQYQDEDVPNYRAVKICERHIANYFGQAGIWGEILRQEVLSCINWADDNCVEKLEKLGWMVVRGEAELMYYNKNCER